MKLTFMRTGDCWQTVQLPLDQGSLDFVCADWRWVMANLVVDEDAFVIRRV